MNEGGLSPTKHMPSSLARLKDFQPVRVQLYKRHELTEWRREQSRARRERARLESRKGLSNLLRGVFNLRCLTRHFYSFQVIYLSLMFGCIFNWS